mmetsp:Transcript_21123/g.42091  ORF Transcript_21123/g.42091 Transcript_21123/m.42091 type:complete len:113 (-) Transcript_21123:39-377(-)|eukprot:CAMPEP_0182453364 /NCGR_PEP_ID=MMETSP1319-20130603/459_1 /TAXON_ID=172717 /ORGANISM="Bolidomonas pacifica, Strain RCC208" /LENGTH=112 /DNA_ID=CAMNT_0024651291 /DNA_START=298 /DNA_END=636 /DNA_ORIENTATION=+
MSKHHPDLVQCTRLPGLTLGLLCSKCDGRCVVCDSFVNPCEPARLCDQCSYGASNKGACVVCGNKGSVATAFYCAECVALEKDRVGCPKIINLGESRTDLFYAKKKYGFKKR